MKEKIFQALKTKYKNLGFGDKAFEGVAAYLAITITEEEQIEDGITGVEPLLKGFQGDIDKRVTDAVAKVKTESKKEELHKEEPPAGGGEEPGKEIPEWAKALIDSTKAVQQELTNLRAGKTAETRTEKLKTKLQEAKAQEAFTSKILKDLGRMNFETEEDFDAYVTETVEAAKDFVQVKADEGLGGLPRPWVKAEDPKKEASREEVKKLMKLIK